MSRPIIQSYKHKDSGFRIYELGGRKDGKTSWQVVVGRSKAGKLNRKTLPSKTAAEEWAVKQRREIKTIGNQALEFTDKQKEDYKVCLSMLSGYECNVREAVQYYVDNHKPVDANNDLAHMVDLYWENQTARFNKGVIRERTLKESKDQLKAFREDFKGRNVSTIKTKDVEAWLDQKTTARTARENYRRYIKILFNFCVDKGVMPINPTPDQDEAEKGQSASEPEIYTALEVSQVMNEAKTFAKGTESRMYIIDGEKQYKDRRAMVAYLALNFWAGIRPTELERLDWADITIRNGSGSILIRKEVSKTKSDRRITIEPNLLKWLKVYKGVGKVFPYSSATLRKWRRGVFEAAGVGHKQDSGRHSYASHHLSKYENLTKLRVHMGHSAGSDVLFKHYISLAEHVAEDASDYFDIRPAGSKVIQLKQTA